MLEIGSRVDKLDSVWEGKFLTSSLSNAADSNRLTDFNESCTKNCRLDFF